MDDDDQAYREEQTPFLAQHKCSKEPYILSASTYHKAYTPRQHVAEGELAAACFGPKKFVGTVSRIVKKGRSKYVVFEENADKHYHLSKCVRLPVVNEFVRHKQTGKWFKVSKVNENGSLDLLAVLKNGTPSQGTPTKEKALAKKKASAAETVPNAAASAAENSSTASAAEEPTEAAASAAENSSTASAAEEPTEAAASADENSTTASTAEESAAKKPASAEVQQLFSDDEDEVHINLLNALISHCAYNTL